MLFLGSLILIALAAIATSLLFRRLGLPGSRVVGGLVVGIAFGPTVLGRIAPEPWADIMMGGTELRSAVQETERAHAAWQFAAGAVPLSIEEMELEAERQWLEVLPMKQALRESEERHARPWMILTVMLAVGAAACGGLARRSRRPKTSPGDDHEPAGTGLADAAAVGAWAAAVPILAAILTFTILGNDAFNATSLVVAAAVGIGAWTLDPIDRRLAGGRNARIELLRAGNVATMLAAVLILIAAWRAQTGWGLVGVALLPLVVSGAASSRRWPVRRLRDTILLPSLAALTVVRSELFLETPWLLTILLIVIAGDGRWLGWFLGLLFSGFEPDQASDSRDGSSPGVARVAFRRSLAAIDTAGPQLAVAGGAVALGLISPGLAISLVLAAATLDVTAPLRRRFARSLERPA